MAVLRVCLAILLILLLGGVVTRAADPAAEAPAGLYGRPVLVVDPGMHTAPITKAAADKDGRWAVTGSSDKTVRVWSLMDGSSRTIRLPEGPDDIGKVYAVAISPDGALIAAAGSTRWTDADQQEQIYLFSRETGALVQRIAGLPYPVNDLAFSPDGSRLAAMLEYKGLRIYAKQTGWAEEARDEDYDLLGGRHANFARDGRLVTTAFDSNVRLYAAGLRGVVRPVQKVLVGFNPYGIAFSPDGTRIAVGFDYSTRVDILDGRTLARLGQPDLSGIYDEWLAATSHNGHLGIVGWSLDGATLFAAGTYSSASHPEELDWDAGGAGARRALAAGQTTVSSLVPPPGGDMLIATRDPWLGRLAPDGTKRWVSGAPTADFRNQRDLFVVSADGTRIGFGFKMSGASPASFDLTARTLVQAPWAADPTLTPPRQTGLPIQNWKNQLWPMLDFRYPLTHNPSEISRSLAIHPNGDRFVLGLDWSLRAFDAQATALWTRAGQGPVWAVNITGNGRLVVAAYDGIVRWHRMTDGAELLAFMPLADRTNWVAWTPEGFYAATAGAQGTLRWHINRGWDAAADSVPISDIPGSYRPAVLPLVLQELETPRALGLAMMAEHNREVMLRTNSRVPPGAQLHLLAV